MDQIASVQACWRYPVKSTQGQSVDELQVESGGVEGDRRWALLDAESGHLLSAKRFSRLLEATGTEDTVVLPDATVVELNDPQASAVLSEWLGRSVRLASTDEVDQVSYQMTFDPPADDAELFEIPAPQGTFLDLAPLHLLTTATLEACAQARPDLDWDVRRFRPNLVVAAEGQAFVEQDWVGQHLHIGAAAVIEIMMPTVRCAMPLRAQPASGNEPALERQAELFAAMSELNTTAPNHLGVYASVISPGIVRVDDPVRLESAQS